MSTSEIIYERLAFSKGDMIIHEGDQQSQAYLIQSGKVSVYTVREGKRIDLAVLEAGEIIGEMALVSDGLRSANVQALETCNLILISRSEFEERIAHSDRAIRAVVKMLGSRIAECNRLISSHIEGLEALEKAAQDVYEETKEEVPNIDDKRLLPGLKGLLQAIEDFKVGFVQKKREQGYLDK